ncbi:MAG: thiamine ABC transporter ATP-binding protein [Thalassobium sp.]|uniref:thiamine ABC transporter ATP-binding protein n=1 Tax=Octadecabacter sp. SW4 TaxID=2602067 RepID=UPI000C0DEF21|nr:ATP-binding cassette domain-containing protein [Octadecabacter sp. SW4]PHQ85977.1 MAG: thiamine ABC transporter ATP-binding protein [Thalassobium sp.]QEE37001.1 ATP-binding cassette domain-containing protein [Octadecabacter sp. SW4]
MLTLDKLMLTFPDFSLAADLTVPAGGITAVIGPSGEGKSTLLSAIAGFIQPNAGRIVWDGLEITGRPPAERPVSLLFQDNNLFPHLTVAQNVLLGLRPAIRMQAGDADKIAVVLNKVGLAGLDARKPSALSGGQQSRAALARVLLGGRPVVLLDEPFAALGPALRDEMLDLCAEILATQGRTVLMVTHDPRDAARVAGQTIVVMDGQAQKPIKTGPLLDDPPDGLRAYLGE